MPRSCFVCLVGGALLVNVFGSAPVVAEESPATAALSPEEAREEAARLLWGADEPQQSPKPEELQKQFAGSAAQQFSLLGTLQGWRETLDGKKERALWTKDDLSLQLGAKAPSLAGFGGAGVAARWGNWEAGTTFRPEAVSDALVEWDEAMTGREIKPGENRQVSWLRGALLKNETLELQVALAHARREQNGRDGLFWSGNGRLNLPFNWKANGEWTGAQVESGDARSKWRVDARGPIKHPWGEAQAQVDWRETEAGWENLTGADQLGERAGRAEVTQKVAVGELEAQIKLDAARRQIDDVKKVGVGSEIERAEDGVAAHLRLKVTDSVALRAQGSVRAFEIERRSTDLNMTDLLEEERAAGDVGLEWKAGNLKLAALVGRSEATNGAANSEEDRLSLEASRGDSLKARFTQRLGEGRDWSRVQTLRVEAAPAIGGVRLRTRFDVARDMEDEELAQRAEVGVQFAKRSQLNVAYRDGGFGSDVWRDPLAARFTGAKDEQEWSTKFQTGSAVGGGGLGLAVEYARRSDETEAWRVGVSYR